MGVDQKIRIAVFHSPNPLIRVHPSSSQLLNATEGRRYRCFFGCHSAEAVLFLDPAVPANTVWLSDGLSRQVMLNVSSDLVSAEMTTSDCTSDRPSAFFVIPSGIRKRNN